MHAETAVRDVVAAVWPRPLDSFWWPNVHSNIASANAIAANAIATTRGRGRILTGGAALNNKTLVVGACDSRHIGRSSDIPPTDIMV